MQGVRSITALIHNDIEKLFTDPLPRINLKDAVLCTHINKYYAIEN